MDVLVPILITALFGALAASHKERRAWLWAILCGLIPIALFVLALNRCFRCESAERNSHAVHWFIGLSAVGLFAGILFFEAAYNFDIDDPEREQYRISSEAPRKLSARYQAEKVMMLRLINDQRRLAGVPPVQLSTNEAAQLHAESLRDDCFVSHWGRNGMKPYMRYSLSGGYQFNAENVAGLYNCGQFDPYEDIESTLGEYVWGFMESEGHRETMLDPLYRKVSIGIAVDRGVWVVQQFEGDYVEFDELPSLNAGNLSMTGRTHQGAHLDEDVAVLVEYDPPLKDLTLEQLEQTQCYGSGLPVAILIKNPFDNSDLEDPYVREIVDEMLDSLEEENPLLYQECRNPYKIPSGQNTPGSSKPERLLEEEADDEIVEREVRVPFFLADDWLITDSGEFSLKTDIGDAVERYGEGVYTITIVAKIDGALEPISQYALLMD